MAHLEAIGCEAMAHYRRNSQSASLPVHKCLVFMWESCPSHATPSAYSLLLPLPLSPLVHIAWEKERIQVAKRPISSHMHPPLGLIKIVLDSKYFQEEEPEEEETRVSVCFLNWLACHCPYFSLVAHRPGARRRRRRYFSTPPAPFFFFFFVFFGLTMTDLFSARISLLKYAHTHRRACARPRTYIYMYIFRWMRAFHWTATASVTSKNLFFLFLNIFLIPSSSFLHLLLLRTFTATTQQIGCNAFHLVPVTRSRPLQLQINIFGWIWPVFMLRCSTGRNK